jgi:general secretion pathway protein D
MNNYFLTISLLIFSKLLPQTIEEKLASFEESKQIDKKEIAREAPRVNSMLSSLRKELKNKYLVVNRLIKEDAPENEYGELLEDINLLRSEIYEVEGKFRDDQIGEILKEGDSYGIWEQEEINVSQFIVEYGSQDYLYVIPQEVASIKLQLHSSLMIPRESYPSLIEAILKYNGVGIKEVNAYTRQLYVLKQDLAAVSVIASLKYELDALDPKTRVAYLFSPAAENLKSAFYFLERIRDPKSTFIYQVGPKIALIGLQEDVKKLVVMCENIWEAKLPKITRVVPTTRMNADDVIKVLKNYFNGLSDSSKTMVSMKGGHDLSVIPLAKESGVILIGSSDIVERAESIVKETEGQMDDPSELTVYWYTCSHTNPVDLAEILEQVYGSLIISKLEGGDAKGVESSDNYDLITNQEPIPSLQPETQGNSFPGGAETYRGWESLSGGGNKKKIAQENQQEQAKGKKHNFIPYPATGSILMVVRKDTLPKIKEVIKKLDIPKRMVELEVLLCERMLQNSTRTGINLLKIGTNASQTKTGGVSYDRTDAPIVKGIFEFFFSRPSSKVFPAFDVTYNFLLSQEDVRVSACPSVITLNQVPATIAITDQISINNGASPVDTQSNKVFFQDSYERADFGITMTLTPTIHEPDIDDPNQQIYVTLDNNIAFENIKRDSQKDRPDVHKRTVKNQVRIADGQTIILGGLRSKMAEDKNEKIPFLGELPGIGKLFGTTVLNDKSNEMFIFIKPRVVHDPKQDLLRIREDRLKKRPGDIEFLLDKIKEARQRKESRLFERSFNLFFGDPNDPTTQF